MNENMQQQPDDGREPTAEEIMAALFANMVIQNTNMALMFLGKVPHPQTGQPIHDLESAQMFIDQLEMLAYKTRNNLSKEEEQLLKQSLMSLRMAFVEEARKAGVTPPEELTRPETPAPPQTSAPPPSEPAAETPPAAAAEEESRKRFTKKY